MAEDSFIDSLMFGIMVTAVLVVGIALVIDYSRYAFEGFCIQTFILSIVIMIIFASFYHLIYIRLINKYSKKRRRR